MLDRMLIRFNNKKLLILHGIFLVFFIFALVLLFFQRYKLKSTEKELVKNKSLIQSVNSSKPSTQAVNTQSVSGQKALDYCEKERFLSISKNKVASQIFSYLFGFKINAFDKEWKCNDSTMTDKGLVVDCRPISCKDGLYGDPKICSEELANREFSPSAISSISITIKEVLIDSGEDPNKTLVNVYRKTPRKQIGYELGKVSKSSNENEYTISFYSPGKLGDIFSQYSGTLYGSDIYFAEYSIKTKIIGDLVSEEKLISLIEKLIDSIEFTSTN